MTFDALGIGMIQGGAPEKHTDHATQRLGSKKQNKARLALWMTVAFYTTDFMCLTKNGSSLWDSSMLRSPSIRT